MLAVFHSFQIAACRTDENVFRMPPVFGQKVTGKQVEFISAMAAGLFFHPEEILNVRLLGTAFQAEGTVKGADAFLYFVGKFFRRGAVFDQIKMLDLPVHNPVSHWINVITGHTATDTVRLDKRRSPAHERIGDGDSLQVIGGVKSLPERPVTVF
ncbi:MAG: hypothetical protein Q7U02_10440 [Desulfosalsimonadaceae bacterium]|nr:hypothetical protein [Desulfosalsimonadaceae bacterium]